MNSFTHFIKGSWKREKRWVKILTVVGHKSGTRVSFETSFDSKQPKLEPKLVSALSETKRLFRLFRFYIETESFDVSIEPKQTGDQPKQFDGEHILLFFTENAEFFRFFFDFFRFVSEQFVSVVSLLYRNREFD
jgi:hypothetical protein